MAPITPTGEPSCLIQGNTWKWKKHDHPDYPQSASWVLKYNIVGLDTKALTAAWQTAGDDINTWLVSRTPAQTATIDPGRYILHGFFDDATDQYTVYHAPLVIDPDPRTAMPGAFQTHEERMLAIVEAVLEGRATDDMESYTIGGRQVTKIPVRELMHMRGVYAAAVLQQETGVFGRDVEITFG